MNRSRFFVLSIIAFTLSVAVTYLAYRVLTDRATTSDFVNVVTANRDLPIGSRLEEQDLKLSAWPQELAPEGHLEEADIARIIGRGTLYPISMDELILETKLAPEGSGAGLAPTIPEGMRAMAVRVNDVTGVAGFIDAGARVDVILSGSPENDSGQRAKAFLENVLVISAGQNLERSASGEARNVPVVTLAVTPEDAQALALAQTAGNLQLALRNPMDLAVPDPEATRQPSLFQQRTSVSLTSRPISPPSAAPARAVAPPPPPPPAPRPPRVEPVQVELIQGASSTTSTFEIQPGDEVQPD